MTNGMTPKLEAEARRWRLQEQARKEAEAQHVANGEQVFLVIDLSVSSYGSYARERHEPEIEAREVWGASLEEVRARHPDADIICPKEGSYVKED